MENTPTELGFRMPAEWEKHSAVWLQWPYETPLYNSGQKAGDKTFQLRMEKTWLLMSWELHQHEKVCVIAKNQEHQDYLQHLFEYMNYDLDRIEIYQIPSMDVWHRDSGPVFVTNNRGELAATSWNFNGWGRYPNHGEREGQIPQAVADILSIPCFRAPIVTEGGAIEVNGSGSLIATRSSILNDNRNPGVTQQDVEKVFEDYLGVSNVIWLSGAPPEVCEKELGDGTDYHVDIAARFVNQNTVVYTWTDDETDPRYPYLAKHLEELQAAKNEAGSPLTLIPLEMPLNGVYTTTGSMNFSIGGYQDEANTPAELTDASYTNYLVANGVVLVPVFGNINDQKARDVLKDVFPERKIIGIPCVSLTADGGAVHCVTQQQPAI